MNETLFLDAAQKAGATKAALVDVSDIVLDPAYYDICENGHCGSFGLCYACPPDIGQVKENMERIRSFSRGLLYQTIRDIEDSYDIEGMGEAAAQHAKIGVRVRREIERFYAGRTLHLSCGGCHLCPRCAKRDGLPCRMPDLVMPAMEGMGVDVYKTTLSTDLKYINGVNTVTYFGLVLFGPGETPKHAQPYI